MNEQVFDKLIYDSGLIAQGCWDKFDEYDHQALRKFAELIVKECSKICDNIYFDNYPDAEKWEHSQEADMIKKHFGVK